MLKCIHKEYYYQELEGALKKLLSIEDAVASMNTTELISETQLLISNTGYIVKWKATNEKTSKRQSNKGR